MAKSIDILSNLYFHVVYQDFKDKKYKPCIIAEDGSVINKSVGKLYNGYTFFDYFQNQYAGTFVQELVTPFFICTGIGSIRQLDNLLLNQEQIDHLNSQGLSVFFFENLIYDIHNDKSSKFYITDIEPNKEIFYNKFKNMVTGFENNSYSNIWSYELESLKKFVKTNNLIKVCAYVTDHYLDDKLLNNYPEFTIKTKDVFLASLFKNVDTQNFNYLEYSTDKKVFTETNIEYKFISLNRRYMGVRRLLSAVLINKNCLLTFNNRNRLKNFNHDLFLWFKLEDFKKSHPNIHKRIKNNLKYVDDNSKSIDFDVTDGDNVFNKLTVDNVPLDLYKKAAIAIVSESRFATPYAILSEKTINTIKSFRPFILLAPPFTLRCLQEYGIKTFGDYWDESYDSITHHETRLLKIFELIEYIDTLPLEKLKTMYQSMIPILQHNYETIKNLKY